MAATALQTKRSPTNADVVAAIGELHDCLHAVEKKIDGVKKDVSETKERVARVEGYQSGIATHLRVRPEGDKPSFLARNKTPIATAGAVLGVMTAFVSLYPLLRVLFLALDAYLTARK